MPSITIPGKPFGKQRPYVVSAGNFGKTHTPTETVNYEVMIKLLSIKARAEPIEGAVRMMIVGFFKPPKAISKKKREAMLRNEIVPTTKPDWDNIGKVVSDGLKHLFDDKVVATSTVKKRYAEQARVEIYWASHSDQYLCPIEISRL